MQPSNLSTASNPSHSVNVCLHLYVETWVQTMSTCCFILKFSGFQEATYFAGYLNSEELKAFLLADSPHADNIGNVEWLAKLAYLADIFEKLNVLNLSLQGKDKTILEVSDKVMGFVKKLRLWHQCAENDNNFEMFPLYDNFYIHSAVEKDQFKS